MAAYYNEIDPGAAAWLRELIKAGQIAAGVEKIEWAQPPAWALPWDAGNALVRRQEQAPRFKPSKSLTSGQDFAKLLAS